jgi:Fe-S-cluster-containing dehydrogenase component
MACYACFMACKDEHCGWASKLSAPQPHMGQYWMNIKEWERGDNERRIKTATVPTPCSHCDNPACQAAATVEGAVYKRPDGVVIIDPEKAKGQKQIVDACPIGAIYWNEELQLPQKCTMCAELLDDPEYPGKEPRCVEACPNEALIFGDLDDPESAVSKRIARGTVTPLKGLEGIKTSVVHLNVPTAFLAGTVFYPAELEEVCIGAHVKATCECGTVYEMDTNWAGDWEFEDLPLDKTFTVEITMEGYKPVTYTVTTDADHYVAETYLEKQ